MNFAEKYITNITKDDMKYACTYKVHASYVFVGIIVTWILSIMSTIITTLFLASVFITIVNVARRNRDGDGDELNIMLSKLNESSSEGGSRTDSDHDSPDSDSDPGPDVGGYNSGDPLNSLSGSVLNDSDEVISNSATRDESENKKIN